MQDKLDKAKAAIGELFEMQDEVVQVMILVYMVQNGHTTEDDPCSEETLVKLAEYVVREMLPLGLWTNVIRGKLKMVFNEDDNEPRFTMTDSGVNSVESLSR